MTDIETGLKNSTVLEGSKPYVFFVFLAISVSLIIFLFSDSLSMMVQWWERDEYSHGYMIPVISLLLVLQSLPSLSKRSRSSSWAGVVLVVLSVGLWVVAELSSLFIISQYSFLLAIYAVSIAVVGWRGFFVVFIPLIYLVFMIPLPSFLYSNLSQTLQLISSQLGVMVVRAFDISVYLEGNVIDLGVYKLQVVEACSGLRYLFPLMSFGFLMAAVYKGKLWHKVVIFLSTIPITVLMNSFRIGLIGVTVEYWGIEMAEGVLHDFEGWVIFIACLFFLFLEIALLGFISGMKGAVIDRFNLDLPDFKLVDFNGDFFLMRNQRPLVGCFVVLMAALFVSGAIKGREDIHPERESFVSVPLVNDNWRGKSVKLSEDVLGVLKLTDYMNANYISRQDGAIVNLYAAYYASQRRGASIHSPKSCLPGGGWVLQEFGQHEISNVPSMKGVNVNRSIIVKGESKQLVYYWFEQRGRKLTNEYLLKWYLMQDAIMINRTDGALVRLVSPIAFDETAEDVDKRFESFLLEFYPDVMKAVPGV
ncbi:exosortase D (VPLPA-CTERM-specific) [Sinobacterium caligoides]|uniref:Exosortase D (VPLPA-CTERM-specific) n=1 Tax=Sinobacterium caligoides TaxID=933926 RepID=A0A3N2E1Y0_9GAMM|nr:VPLPA-CTERM-specific exosortase XrtD [Sinobacterium caligoides]ROS06128.1 exosortase D (VPLPA-CTERM-specific) [Sinobacterium caligoides]